MDTHLQEYQVHTFKDFVTANHHTTIPVLGKRSALEALNRTLSAGHHAQSANPDNKHPAYDPLVVALNTICTERKMPLITGSDLYSLQFIPEFASFAKNFIKTNHAQHLFNVDNFFSSQGTFTEDHMVLMTAAFAASSGYGDIGLGIVTLVNGQAVKAFHYPESNRLPDYTAWIIADFRGNDAAYYGIGQEAVQQQQHHFNDQEESYADANDDDADDEGDIRVPSTTPRKTAARVLAQQIPLPAHLTADDILQHHKSRLQYNNVLKVALLFSNKEIADQFKSDLLPKDQRLCHASAVVKRVNTAINWIEDQFEIDNSAFRAVFDQERRNKGIAARGKDEVSDEILTANSSKVGAAMEWIRAGGPRPNHNLAPTLYDPTANTTSVTDGLSTDSFSGAPVHRLGTQVPPGYVPAGTIPAGAQGSLRSLDPGYYPHSQIGVGNGGDMMDLNDGSFITNDNGTDENYDFTGMIDDEVVMENHDWDPEVLDFERSLAEDVSWKFIG
jgi:hypothetical protein